MPPKNAASNATGRKGPQFKPPRPVKDTAQPSALSKRGNTSSRTAGAAAKTTAPAKRAVQPEAEMISSGDEGEELDDMIDDSDDLMEDAPARNNARQNDDLAPEMPPVPTPLLARLLYQNFEDPNTQLQKGAMELTGKYIDIFVREALARAKQERETTARTGGFSDGFLQVEDLEKLAPQLVLDF